MPTAAQPSVKRCAQHRDWLRFERLPADAPSELNPLEPLWDCLDDHALANTPAENLPRLGQRVRWALRALQRRPAATMFFATCGILKPMENPPKRPKSTKKV